MNKNRALEFLIAARGSLQLPLTQNRKKALLYIELAITELYELLETVNALTDEASAAMGETPRGAVVMLNAREGIPGRERIPTMETTPAMLVENSRAALPGAR